MRLIRRSSRDTRGSLPAPLRSSFVPHTGLAPVACCVVNTRRELLLLLRKHPGITVAELAQELQLTGMGVRRHLDALASDGLVETVTSARRGLGRPASGWRLTA